MPLPKPVDAEIVAAAYLAKFNQPMTDAQLQLLRTIDQHLQQVAANSDMFMNGLAVTLPTLPPLLELAASITLPFGGTKFWICPNAAHSYPFEQLLATWYGQTAANDLMLNRMRYANVDSTWTMLEAMESIECLFLVDFSLDMMDAVMARVRHLNEKRRVPFVAFISPTSA